MFDLDSGEVTIPAGVQKEYPVENKSPRAATLRLDPYGHFNTTRLLRMYFSELEEAGEDYLFPSRQGGHINTNSARNITERLAIEGDVCPKRTDGKPSEFEEAHPHAFRHSVANYMLADPDTRLIDVRNRLRHRSITTTERVYEHYQRR
ncbi:tyrosine-type recombinase/integrase [Natrialba swarupiae]|uniref:Tyrosine-type recombinase/integrase n=2 Tax=Natrialba swarupiae TaxID=2448032 RepID=A0A5D5ANP8_9EURY|nr:tyrosine-type recombinase/integrase [Natrialba swarupiae]